MTVQTKFTYEDYLLFPDDGRRHELIDGEHYTTPSPSERHQRVVLNLAYSIAAYIKQHPVGRLYTAPFDVVLSNLDVVQPDLIFVSSTRASIITEKNIRGTPDLLIEIISETTRRTDEIIKRKLYERYGVGEYWIVDPELETMKIYRMTPDGYGRAAELSCEAGDAIHTPLLPELSIPLIDLFR